MSACSRSKGTKDLSVKLSEMLSFILYLRNIRLPKTESGHMYHSTAESLLSGVIYCSPILQLFTGVQHSVDRHNQAFMVLEGRRLNKQRRTKRDKPGYWFGTSTPIVGKGMMIAIKDGHVLTDLSSSASEDSRKISQILSNSMYLDGTHYTIDGRDCHFFVKLGLADSDLLALGLSSGHKTLEERDQCDSQWALPPGCHFRNLLRQTHIQHPVRAVSRGSGKGAEPPAGTSPPEGTVWSLGQGATASARGQRRRTHVG